MSERQQADVVVIGGGPGGYVAAIRAAQLGLHTVCVEKDATLGGTCVNVGCIPSKALLQSSEYFEFASKHGAEHGLVIDGLRLDLNAMQKRKVDVVAANTRGVEYLFRKNKVEWARGTGTLREGNVVHVQLADGGSQEYLAQNVIIATGSVPASLPFLRIDERRVVSNVGALAFTDVPESLLVVGGGVIGLELGSVWRRLGAKVTVVELLPHILPGSDADVVKEAERVFRKQGLQLRTGTKITGAEAGDDAVTVILEKDGRSSEERFERVLVAIGRKPTLHGVDATALGLALGRGGEVIVDGGMRTNLPGVYAIGDVVGGKLLAHKAEEEGVVAAEVIAGMKSVMHYHSIPSVVYTWPEIVAIGMTEQEARDSEIEIRVGRFPFTANGRARTLGETSGFVKLVADARTDELLGAHLIGPNVSELAAELVLAFEYRASAEDVALTVHAHPTLSEAVKEAALGVGGRGIHM